MLGVNRPDEGDDMLFLDESMEAASAAATLGMGTPEESFGPPEEEMGPPRPTEEKSNTMLYLLGALVIGFMFLKK